MRQQLPQTINQILDRESGSARARGKFTRHLHQLTFALDRSLFHFLVRDEGPRALMSFEQTAQLQFAIGPHHRIGIDGNVHGQLSHRGQLLARQQRAGSDPGPHLIDELAVDWDAGMEVERELERPGVLARLSHACQCTIQLVHYVKYFFERRKTSNHDGSGVIINSTGGSYGGSKVWWSCTDRACWPMVECTCGAGRGRRFLRTVVLAFAGMARLPCGH